MTFQFMPNFNDLLRNYRLWECKRRTIGVHLNYEDLDLVERSAIVNEN